jgi:hypothetical protein
VMTCVDIRWLASSRSKSPRVSKFYLKIGEGAMADGARGVIVEVAWKRSERRSVQFHRVQRN